MGQATISGYVFAIRFGIRNEWVRVDFVLDDDGFFRIDSDGYVYVTSTDGLFAGTLALPVNDVRTIAADIVGTNY